MPNLIPATATLKRGSGAQQPFQGWRRATLSVQQAKLEWMEAARIIGPFTLHQRRLSEPEGEGGSDEDSLIAAVVFFTLAICVVIIIRYVCIVNSSRSDRLMAVHDGCSALLSIILRPTGLGHSFGRPPATHAPAPHEHGRPDSDENVTAIRMPAYHHIITTPSLRNVRQIVLRDTTPATHARNSNLRADPHIIVASGHVRQSFPATAGLPPPPSLAVVSPPTTEPQYVELLCRTSATQEDEDVPCIICLEPLCGDKVVAGACLHWVHESCLRAWLAKSVKQDCPVCRLSFTRSPATDMPSDVPSVAPVAAVVTW